MDEKLQKVLARAGYGSRREMENWIQAGRINVNGKVATLGDRVGAGDKILVDGKKLANAEAEAVPQAIILYNKPEGEICSRKDPEGRPTVYDRLPQLRHARWVSVGRLDINTSGLLLFTTDGELANRLMHPSQQIEREYAVRVRGEVTEALVNKMHEGVMLEDGFACFTDIQYFAGEGVNHWYHVVIMEGRNREVRRLWESQGLTVSRLKRVRFANIFIPSTIKVGEYCELAKEDVRGLYRLVGLRHRPAKKSVLPEKRRLTQPTGQKSTGQKPAGQRPPGQKSTGQKSTGQKSTGQKSAGQRPAGQKPASQKPAGQKLGGRKPPGRKPTGR